MSTVSFHREHYRRLVSQLYAQDFPNDDRLGQAVARASEAVGSLVHRLAERSHAGVH